MKKTPTLKPCPFCGKPAQLIEDADHHGGFFELGCPDTECPAHWTFYTDPIDERDAAIAKWNTRTPTPTTPEEASDEM